MSLTPNRIGTALGPFLSHIEMSENTRTGSETLYVFEGSLSECQAERSNLRAEGAAMIRLADLKNGHWEVTAQFPYNEYDQEQYPLAGVHELELNIEQPSPYESPVLLSLLTMGQVAACRKVINDFNLGLYPRAGSTSPAFTDAESDLASQLTALSATSSQLIYGQRLFEQVSFMGLQGYDDYSSTYRRTLTAATPTVATASWTGVGQIWTSAEIMAWENLPLTGWFQLQSGYQWLKSRPRVTMGAGQKTSIEYSYKECKQASGLVYTAYGSALLTGLS
jgi:hypothetical protein